MEIISRFIGLYFLRTSPLDIPASTRRTITVLEIYIIMGIVWLQVFDTVDMYSLGYLLISVISTVSIIWLLLFATGFRAYYQQILTAIVAINILDNLFRFPITLWMNYSSGGVMEGELHDLSWLLLVLLVVWTFIVTVQIFRKALEEKPITSAVLAISYIVFSIAVQLLI